MDFWGTGKKRGTCAIRIERKIWTRVAEAEICPYSAGSGGSGRKIEFPYTATFYD